MKTLAKVLLGIVGVIALAIAAVFYLTADMTTVADEFFRAVKTNDMDKAYTYLSDDFKAGTSKAELHDFMVSSSLSKFKEASWQSRSFHGNRGQLVGSITTVSGGVVPVTLSFVKGEGGWRIYSIQKPSAGI